MYKCDYCNRVYKIKINYDKHYLLCTILYKTERERDEQLPSMHDMYKILLEMTIKCCKLEKKVEELSKWAEVKKRKLNILDWLNENKKCMPFTEWLDKLNINRGHLDSVFKNDLIKGNVFILQNLLSLEEEAPIKAFDQRENVLFIYNEEHKWEIMTPAVFTSLMNTLSKKLLTEFIHWQNENKNKMYQDEFSSTYAANVQKIMGGNLSQEYIYFNVKKEIYKYLKFNLRTIVEYEFTLC